MATRKPILYCPICGLQMNIVAKPAESRKPGPTRWVVEPHTCTSEALQRFVDQMEEDKKEAVKEALAGAADKAAEVKKETDAELKEAKDDK